MRLPQGFFINHDNIEFWNRNKNKYKGRNTHFDIYFPKGDEFSLNEKIIDSNDYSKIIEF